MKSKSRSNIHESNVPRCTGLKQRLRQANVRGPSGSSPKIVQGQVYTPLPKKTNELYKKPLISPPHNDNQLKALNMAAMDTQQQQLRTRSQDPGRQPFANRSAQMRMAVDDAISDGTVEAEAHQASGGGAGAQPDGAWFSRQQSSAQMEHEDKSRDSVKDLAGAATVVDGPTEAAVDQEKIRRRSRSRSKQGKSVTINKTAMGNTPSSPHDDRKALYKNYIRELRDANKDKDNSKHRSQALLAQSFSQAGLNASRIQISQFESQSVHFRKRTNRDKIMRKIVRDKKEKMQAERSSRNLNRTSGNVWDSSNINYESVSKSDERQAQTLRTKTAAYNYDAISGQEGSFSDTDRQENELVDEFVSEINKSYNANSPHMIAQFFTSEANRNRNMFINGLQKDSDPSDREHQNFIKSKSAIVHPFGVMADQSGYVNDHDKSTRYFKPQSRDRRKSNASKSHSKQPVYLYDYQYAASKHAPVSTRKAISHVTEGPQIGGKVAKESCYRVAHPVAGTTSKEDEADSSSSLDVIKSGKKVHLVVEDGTSTETNENDEVLVEDAYKGHRRMSIFKADEMTETLNMKRLKRAQKAQEILQQEKEYFKNLHKNEATYTRGPNGELIFNENSIYYDPVDYMKNKCICARKYHYSVPTTYSDSNVLLNYEESSDSLRVFDLDKGTECEYGGSPCVNLDKLILKVPMSKINGFIYGSFSTRFWMLRIGLNQLILDNSPYAAAKRKRIIAHRDRLRKQRGERARRRACNHNDSHSSDSVRSQPDEFEITKKAGKYDREHHEEHKAQEAAVESKMPFYAWECISLQMEDRDLDLVIRSEKLMKIFILFLIVKLNTHNGLANSLDPLRDKGLIKNKATARQMMQAIYRNFFIMKVRMKISYEACNQCRTIPELILLAILKAYHERNRLGLVAKPHPKVTQSMVHGVRMMCLSGVAKMNVLMNMANTVRAETLKQNRNKTANVAPGSTELDATLPMTPEQTVAAGLAFGEFTDDHQKKVVDHQRELRKKSLFVALTTSVTQQDGVEDLFAKYYESFTEEEQPDDDHLYVDGRDLEAKKDGSAMVSRKVKKQNIASMLSIDPRSNYDEVTLKWKRDQKVLQMRKRMLRAEKEATLQKLQLLLSLRLIRGPLFIYAVLEVIKLSKAILVLQLERGLEAPVPTALGQKHLPQSFQYYDCIMEVVRQHTHEDHKLVQYNDHIVSMRSAKTGCCSANIKPDEPLAVGDKRLESKVCVGSKYKDVGFDESCQAEIVERPLKSWLPNLFKFLTCSNTRQEDREEHLKLKLYERAQSVQAARYLQIEKDKLRLRYRVQAPETNVNQEHKSRSSSVDTTDQQKLFSKDARSRSFSLANMNFADVISLNKATEDDKLKKEIEQMLLDEHLQVSAHYLTHGHVGKKRRSLLQKKVHYQNQLTSLKEKGKRLLKSAKLDCEIEDAVSDFLHVIQSTAEGDKPASPEEILERVRSFQRLQDVFHCKSTPHGERVISHFRTDLLKKLQSIRTFDKREHFLDQKIAYDQRFFNSSYPEFQLMVSDIRKMCRLNEEVVRIRKQLDKAMHDHEHRAHESNVTVKQWHDKAKINHLQTILQDKRDELQDARDESEHHTAIIKKTTLRQQNDYVRSRSNPMSRQLTEHGHQSYEDIIVESDDEQNAEVNHAFGQKAPAPTTFVLNADNVASALDASEIDKSLKGNKLYQSLKARAKDASNMGSPTGAQTPHSHQRGRSATCKVQQSGHLFARLSQLVGTISNDDPITGKFHELSGKIQRRREKMANVSRVSQNCLWSVDHDQDQATSSGIQQSNEKSGTNSAVWGNIRNVLAKKMTQSQVFEFDEQQPAGGARRRTTLTGHVIPEELADDSLKTSKSLADQ